MSYILSILIPTKNRKEYLKKCIDEVLESCSNNVQVVVQDNSDIPWEKSEIRDYIKYANFEYYHESGEISFVDNFSKALDKAKGEYVCFIGDDDGVLPQIENVAEFMKKEDINAVSQNISVTYFWPNDQKAIRNSENGLLRIFYANNRVSKKNTDMELKSLFRTGGQHYLDRGLAKPYHGIVRKAYFEQIKNITGNYINGLSPDIYASVALSSLIKDIYVINFPITISGISPKSGSAASANGSHTGKLKDAPHFKGHQDYIWDDFVPAIYSVETIWADSALHAARDVGFKNVEKHFSYSYLVKVCKKKYPQFSEEYLEFEDRYSYSPMQYFKEFLSYDFLKLIERGLKRVVRKKKDYQTYIGVANIAEAKSKVEQYLKQEKIYIDNTLNGLRKL